MGNVFILNLNELTTVVGIGFVLLSLAVFFGCRRIARAIQEKRT